MVLRSTGADPDDAPEPTVTNVLQPAPYGISDTDDPNHPDYGVVSLNTLLKACFHRDPLKPQVEDFLLCHGINNIFDFTSLDPDDIPAMMTRKRIADTAELEIDETPLPGVVARTIKVLIWYVYWLHQTEFKGQNVIWSKLTRPHYNDFRTKQYRVESFVPNPADDRGNRHIVDHLRKWKRGIRRDPSAYPVLTDEKQWDNWARTVEAEANLQHVHDVLDPTYRPTTRADIAIFKEQNIYMYAIFNRTFMTTVGATIVREHEKDKDAQAIYSKLVQRAILSTQATLDSESLMAYITTAHVGTWHGTTHNFVLHWLEQVRLLHDMIPTQDHMPSNMLLMLLKAAVREFDLLASTENCAEMLRIAGLDDTSHDRAYEAYITLLMPSCTTHDSKYLGTSSSPHSGRHNTDEFFDIHTHVDTVRAHMSSQSAHNSGPDDTQIAPSDTYGANLNRQQWQDLDEESQELWEQLSSVAKDIITARATYNDSARPP